MRPPLTINVNLSARQILEPRLREWIGAVWSSPGSVRKAARARDHREHDARGRRRRERPARRAAGDGIRIAIDDFGTGFSSLGYLQRFPADELKIAKEFVDDMVFDARNARLVDAIVALGALSS